MRSYFGNTNFEQLLSCLRCIDGASTHFVFDIFAFQHAHFLQLPLRALRSAPVNPLDLVAIVASIPFY